MELCNSRRGTARHANQPRRHPAARDALTRLLAWEASRNSINPEATEALVNPVSGATITSPNIAGHRGYAATACPGDTFYPTLPAI